jgi:hypothetical protein
LMNKLTVSFMGTTAGYYHIAFTHPVGEGD